ncbi:hypothetical protein SLEP1_g55294 [Rubroshorea leprosula]|uniref:DUF4283 domain-containing protein n=1 Tax=Rubroshorea leprosula TaxID=152421 RepID=A0AAV5MHZ3_9ROSI|nr:hypothetical protein SLEP1_g55294 [Rubroshorea leprosula]
MRGRERERAWGRRTQGKQISQQYERFRFDDRRRFQQEVGGYDKRVYNQAIPFLFANFPEEWSFEQMWHTFNRIGLGRNEVDLERKLNEVRIGNQVLQANKPRPSYAEVVKVVNSRMEERPNKERREEGTEQKYGSNGVGTFGAQQRQWKSKQQHHHWSGMELNFDLEEYAWLEKCFVGTVHSVNSIPNLQEKFFMEGVFFCNIRPMGRRLVLLEGQDYEDLKELVDTGKDWLGNWFEDVKPWTPTVVAAERFAWIRCQGLLAHAWKSETFETFGRLWGNFVTLDDSTISKKRFDAARFLITTPSTKSISREEDDEGSSSSNNQNEVDSDFDKNMFKQFEHQTPGIEGDEVEGMEDDVATTNMGDGKENEVACQNAEVDMHIDEVEGSKRNEDKEASIGTEIIQETEGMGDFTTRLDDLNSNIQRVGETRRIVADPDLVNNKVDRGDFENDNISINDSSIQNCNKSIETRNRKRNMEALWSRVKEFGVNAQGEEISMLRKLEEMESRDKARWRKEEEKKNRKGD